MVKSTRHCTNHSNYFMVRFYAEDEHHLMRYFPWKTQKSQTFWQLFLMPGFECEGERLYGQNSSVQFQLSNSQWNENVLIWTRSNDVLGCKEHWGTTWVGRRNHSCKNNDENVVVRWIQNSRSIIESMLRMEWRKPEQCKTQTIYFHKICLSF